MSPISLPARRSAVERIRWRLLESFKDFALFALSAFLAFELRFDGVVPTKYLHPFWIALCVWAVVKTIIFTVRKVNQGFWHHTSIYDAQRIALANSAGSVLGGLLVVVLLGPWGIPRSIYILEWIISCFLILGERLAIRAFATARDSHWAEGEGTKTLIYGK